MGLLGKLFQRGGGASSQRTLSNARFFPGDDSLEVVGESHYQDALWSILGFRTNDRVRHSVYAALVPDANNPHDGNAISVQCQGHVVGYLPRDNAALLRPGLLALMERERCHVLLRGVIVGGGYGEPALLGVWLDYSADDFGASAPSRRSEWGSHDGEIDSGFSDAWRTDAEDESYDLSWYTSLPEAYRPAIKMLRELLSSDPDPIDRHFQFAELEWRLYRCRTLWDSALREYDEACVQHDREMDVMRTAFMAKWGKVPRLDLYRQATIRAAKAKNWTAALRWAERGLDVYGQNAAREEAVEDLAKRANQAKAKLAAETTRPATPPPATIVPAEIGKPPQEAIVVLEELKCVQCTSGFTRVRVRGRKPTLCPSCRTEA